MTTQIEESKMIKFQSITSVDYFEDKHLVKPYLPGDHVVITEKIDGANASFQKPGEGVFHRYSRLEELNPGKTLSGFYDAIERALEGKELNPNYRYYGEWLSNHKVIYEEADKKQFYLYDVQDVASGEYLSHELVMQMAKELGLRHAPVLFNGILEGTPDAIEAFVQSFVGKTKMNAMLSHKKRGLIPMGEGIVVRTYNRKRPNGKRIITKIVVDELAESRFNREHKEPKNVSETEYAVAHMTENRIEKMLMKLVDEGVLPEGWKLAEAKAKITYLVERVVKDVLDEHPVSEELEIETVVKILKKRAGGLAFPLLIEKQST